MSTSYGRLAPKRDRVFSLDAEQAVIGCLLRDCTMFDEVDAILQGSESFLLPKHQEIYNGISELRDKGQKVDVVTVHSSTNVPQSDLIELLDSVGTTRNIVEYARIVRDHFIRGRLKNYAHNLIAMCGDKAEPDDLLSFAEAEIISIERGMSTATDSLIGDGLEDLIAGLDSPGVVGVSSGFSGIDEKIGRLRNGEFIVIAGRPSMGKSALAVNMLQHLSISSNNTEPAGLISIEMSKQAIQQRLLSSLTRIPMNSITSSKIKEDEWDSIAKAQGLLSEGKLCISDNPHSSMQSIRSTARRWKNKRGIRLLVVDYLQLIVPGRFDGSRYEEVTNISRQFKELARELEIPVVVLSQLNRGSEYRKDGRPMLSDLRESGAIEQDADLVMFCYRPAYYMPSSTDEEKEKRNIQLTNGKAEVIIAKQRNGPVGTVDMFYNGPYCKFSMEQSYSNAYSRITL